MTIFETLRDLLEQIRLCLDDTSCEYSYFVSLGIPPAECNSIAVWHGDIVRSRENSECSNSFISRDLNITITRCCVRADAAVGFDQVAESDDAMCFLSDLESLIECLVCTDPPLLSGKTMACAATMNSVRLDLEKLGGCYSATINLSYDDVICCP